MSSDVQTEALTAQYAALRQKFVTGLRARLQEIGSTTDAQTLHAHLHRLAGAAGAYGYADLGEIARKAMHSVSGEANNAATQDALDQLEAAIQALL